MKQRFFLLTVLFAATITLNAQEATMRFKKVAYQMNDQWFTTAEARCIADSVMKYQFPSGGWAKNTDWHLSTPGATEAKQLVWNQIHSDNGVGSTIDNGATTSELLFLAKIYKATKKKAYREALLKGIDYLLAAQYDNGGWPQYYPHKPKNNEGHPFYSDHITFNDNAMVFVMQTLRSIANEQAPYDVLNLSEETKERLNQSFNKGIECILNCQIKKNGRLTVWCQQHDEYTLAPAPARAYELASFTGSHETVEILELLMSLPAPTPRVLASVTAAVEWLKSHAIQDMALETYTNRDGKRDRRLVHRFGSQIWARYYNLDTEEPYVCDRDGIPQPSLEYIGYERRNGYGWYGTTPANVIKRYPEWMRSLVNINNN